MRTRGVVILVLAVGCSSDVGSGKEPVNDPSDCWGLSVDDCPEDTCAVEFGTPYDEEQECYGAGAPMYCAPAGMNCANNTSTVLDPDGTCYFTGSSECPVPVGWTAEDGVVSCPNLGSVPECP